MEQSEFVKLPLGKEVVTLELFVFNLDNKRYIFTFKFCLE